MGNIDGGSKSVQHREQEAGRAVPADSMGKGGLGQHSIPSQTPSST